MNLNSTSTSSVPKAAAVCAGFGEPGWAPFCFLNGNPVFNAFDVFQAFIQSSIVSLHNVLQVSGVGNDRCHMKLSMSHTEVSYSPNYLACAHETPTFLFFFYSEGCGYQERVRSQHYFVHNLN